MSSLVIDTSVSMAWCFRDELDAYALGVLEALGAGQALVPQLWPVETANVLALAERNRRLTATDLDRYLGLLGALSILVDSQTADRATTAILAVARRFGLTAYDAAYLELAQRESLPLASRDKALLAACRKAGVEVFRVPRRA